MPSSKIELSIIIVNYNGEHYIRRCLDSILESLDSVPFEILVIDNNSQDNSRDILSHYEDKARVFYNSDNLGFSKANNQGLAHSNGDYVLLLNNDTVLKKTALRHMIDYFKGHPETGALSPKLLNPDGSLQIQGSALGAWRFRAKTARKVPFICAAALLMRRDILREIGGLDENLFFYNEDVDLCHQLRRRKHPIIYLPDAEVIHFGGLSTKTRKAGAIVDGYRGGLYLSKKSYPLPVHYLYRLILFLDILPKFLFYCVISTVKKDYDEYRLAYKKIIEININGKFKR